MAKDELYDADNVKMNTRRTTVFLALLIIHLINTSCGYLPEQIFYEDPLTAQEHNNLGVVYEKEGKLDLALREYRKSINKDPSLITPLINIGNIYLKKKHLDNAEEYYLKALSRDKFNINAANNLGNVYLQKEKDYSRGIEFLALALKNQKDPSAHALHTLSELYIRTGQLTEAVEILTDLCSRVQGNELHKSVEEKLKLLGRNNCS